MEWQIRLFEPPDQSAARRVILEGLRQHHLEEFDETRNPDLDDITATYVDAGHLFVVAEVAGQVVGTGVLKAEGERTGRIERNGHVIRKPTSGPTTTKPRIPMNMQVPPCPP